MAKEPLTNVTAWTIYADALELLSMAFWISLLVGIAAAIAVVALSGGLAAAVTIGVAVSGFTWPIMFGLRASKVKAWAAKQAS